MIEKAKEFCGRLGIAFTEELVPYYEKGEKLYAEYGSTAVDIARLTSINTKYNAYRLHFGEVIKAAELIAEDSDMIVWIYTLIAIMAEDAPVKYLPVPDRERADTDFLPLFAFMWYFDDMADVMAKRGVPFDVISDTLHEFEAETNDYFDLYGRRGIRRYVSWFMHFYHGEILRIGRLNFEMTTLSRNVRVYEKDGELKVLMDDVYMHRKGMIFGSGGQTDEDGKYRAVITETADTVTGYAANEYGECDPEPITLTGWREVMRKGDKIISVHIPALDPLTDENCDAAYAKARSIFTGCYPEHDFKGFCCFSWMMEKRLRQIMGRDTNVTRFCDKFTGFPLQSNGKAVNSFLFHVPGETEAKDLPEDTSMQRAVKKFILDGGVFYEKGGVFI